MGVDRIGQGGPPIPVPEAGGSSQATHATPAGAPFRVPPAAPAAVSASRVEAGQATGASPLERFRAGAIDVGGYVDLKVDEATSHLAALPPGQLEAIRSTLRERMASDPSLVELLHAATGEALAPDAPEAPAAPRDD